MCRFLIKQEPKAIKKKIQTCFLTKKQKRQNSKSLILVTLATSILFLVLIDDTGNKGRFTRMGTRISDG